MNTNEFDSSLEKYYSLVEKIILSRQDPVTGLLPASTAITAHGDYFYIIERDNQIGSNAVTKKLYRVAASQMVPAKLGETLPVVTKELVRDLLPDLTSTGGYVVDKVEGLAIFEDGTTWISTDNDGVDDSSGETMFWSIGSVN